MKIACCCAAGFALLLLSGCAPETGAADPALVREIDGIRAVDNHAHPVRVTAAGEQPDRLFDALPVDNMEPQSDPVNLRAGSPAAADASRELYGDGGRAAKPQAIQQKGDQYPLFVLDRMGVEVMLANRVEMGSSIQPPRFRWVPYADALLFPLDTSRLAARNSDRSEEHTSELQSRVD